MLLRKLTVPSSEVIDLIEATKLHKSGYSPLTGMHENVGVLARIDTPDWRKVMARDVSELWVYGLGFQAANEYRNKYTKDRIVVPLTVYYRVKGMALFFYWNGYQEHIGESRNHYVK